MNIPKGLETVKLSQQAKEQLIRLKRATGILHWNVLCRWALVTSLADSSEPPNNKIVTNSSVEMDWRTFAGDWGEVYLALLAARYEPHEIEARFRQHLHRGVAMLLASRGRSLSLLVDFSGREPSNPAKTNS